MTLMILMKKFTRFALPLRMPIAQSSVPSSFDVSTLLLSYTVGYFTCSLFNRIDQNRKKYSTLQFSDKVNFALIKMRSTLAGFIYQRKPKQKKRNKVLLLEPINNRCIESIIQTPYNDVVYVHRIRLYTFQSHKHCHLNKAHSYEGTHIVVYFSIPLHTSQRNIPR